MATPPASGGQPEEYLAALQSNPGVRPEVAPNFQQQTEGALSASSGTKRKRAPVWDYFAKEKVHGVWKAQCIYCMKYISGETHAGPGSAHLIEHLDNCIGGKKQISLSSRSGKRRKVSVESCISDQQVARKALSSMFIQQIYLLCIADNPGIRTFVGALQPFYEMVNQNTIRRDNLDLYKARKKKVLDNLQKNKVRVAVTAEFWIDSKKGGYMAVTGHFIDESWKPRRSILRFLRVPCPRTSDVISEALYKCLQSWDLDCKLSTLNLENYSSDDDLIPLIKAKIGTGNLLLGGKMLHMGCCAHNLNSVVHDGLEVIWTEIERIRDCVAYCLSTPKRYEMFEEAAESQQVELTEELCLDCKTSWNSTYTMLTVALLYKKVFDHLKQIDNHFTSCPTAEDWELVSSACDRLKDFHKLSEMFSGTEFVTGNKFFVQICQIKIRMRKWLGCGDPLIEKMSATMIEKFDKYWSDFHELMALATILDPRGKTAALHVLYGILFGEENADYHVKRSVDLLRELVNEYKNAQTEEDGMSTLSCAPSSLTCLDEVSQIFDDFDALIEAEHAEWMKKELDHYLEEDRLRNVDKNNFDVIRWWNYGNFPTLRMIARDIFAIPITTVASESGVSVGGRVLSGHLSSLAPKMLEALICTRDWLHNELQGEDETGTSNVLGRR